MYVPQVSDDEDDTHPNIDTPSLFRWRHQARVERMEEQKKEKTTFEQESSAYVCVCFMYCRIFCVLLFMNEVYVSMG